MKNGLLFTFNEIYLRLRFFQFLKDKQMSEYFAASDFSKKPNQASEEAAGYDLLASEAMTLLLNS